MARRSLQERIAETEQKIRQLQALRQQLAARARQQERKARTRRLIQMGGVMAVWGFSTPEQVDALMRMVRDSVLRDEVLARLQPGDPRGRWQGNDPDFVTTNSNSPTPAKTAHSNTEG